MADNRAAPSSLYLREESALSSQIDGAQSTLADLLRFETEAQGASRSTMSGRFSTTWTP